ncbi:MAG: UDP-N-acetylmuramoyl-L-alanyl-D-glutamate--2,6-diaminopimelate ligase [Candidatus Shapirobacteria bacterium]
MIQKLKNILWHLPKNFLLSLIYGFPARKLILIGVTGTDGKTTTCNLIHHVLTNSGIKAGLISTIGAKIGDSEYNTQLHMTSPDPIVIQKLLRQMVKEKVTHVVLEVTAHAIDQFRYFGCKFEIAGLTNISHEHLDYFRDLDTYISAKTKLFKAAKTVILNKDDDSFNKIKKEINKTVISYGIDSKSNYHATKIKIDKKNIEFKVKKLKIITDSNYYYQIYNILLTFAIIDKLNIDPNILIQTVKVFPKIKGRTEEFPNDFKFKTLIDFAHTPAALESTLLSLKKNTTGKIIIIFGATGGRDKSKRPIMGKVVSENANIAIITADDTRDEKVEDINQQIISGIVKRPKFKYFDIPNRQDAFNLAIKLAETGDTIIACGKGHETSILHGKTEYPWSEAEAYRTAFRYKNIN